MKHLITRRQPLCRFAKQTADAHDMHPLLQRIFENRNVGTPAELDYSLKRLLSPHLLKGIDTATALLQQAIAEHQKIVVVGDYDTDGATATTVALLGLRALGARCVEYLAPNRFEYGYGLSAEIAAVALQSKPDLVITVDNGIASIDGVSVLRAAGVAVVVTDHHLAGADLPAANAIVNPNQPGCDFPSKNLAGVGVMFYVLLALRTAMRAAGGFNAAQVAEPNLADLLDLVALGSVADMVPLDYNNRILVAQGVARVRAEHCRPGIRAIMEVAGKECRNLGAADFGFIIGPRLNAAGRIDDISAGIECLLADDYVDALQHAQQLDDLNRERREIEQSMQARATQIVAQLKHNADADRFECCLFDRDWHQGLVGLVASRVREKINLPVVAFAPAEGGWLRGSARSVPGLHIRDLLEAISIGCPGLIEKFGGHAMAAGLTLAEENYQTFSEQFGVRVAAHFKDASPVCDILTDGELTSEQMTLETAELVRNASPWGQHFPVPLFDGEFRVIDQRIVADQHLKMILAPLNGNHKTDGFEAILFRYVEPGEHAPALDTVRAAYQLQVNDFRGKRSLQLLVEHLQPSTAG